MKVLLIIPAHPYLGDQKRNASLGIMYIAAVVKEAGYEVEIVDLRDVEKKYWISKISASEVYGITASTPDYPIALDIARKIKENFSGVVVLGGIHASAESQGIDSIFDKVVIGEGENTFLNVLRDIERGVDKRYYSGKPIEDLNGIPFPARDMLPYDSVVSNSLVEKDKPATAVITSRGCPFDCSFCASKTIWGRKVRFRSADNVIAEIKQVIDDYGVYHYRFQDDTLTLNRERFLELSKKMAPLGIFWRCNTRLDCTQKDILSAMKNSGCQEVGFGIESASQKVLDINSKGISLEKAVEVIKNTKEAGLKVRLFFMIGLPGEDSNISRLTIDFIKATEPDGVDLSTFIPFPGCDIYMRPDHYGVKMLSKDYKQYVMTVGLYGNELERDFVYETPLLTNEELKQHRRTILEFIKKDQLVLNK